MHAGPTLLVSPVSDRHGANAMARRDARTIRPSYLERLRHSVGRNTERKGRPVGQVGTGKTHSERIESTRYAERFCDTKRWP